ncbi:glycoside-pentoside-hexuronide (GPH):cation symporter [Clostridium neuense]|uniref:Glycoside-pentoside-hexuronide (GPH):cation symporter n=1 Tax=Clostridium neuense TaxID=1728934 RepID=A0ABW8TK18_9CLOT
MKNDVKRKISIPIYQRISYGMTDCAGNLLYVVISTYLLYYFTDVFGLSVGIAGTLLLATRLVDAIDAPIWGFLVDHTHTKWGQSRPYFLWLCIPFAFFTWLTFTTPHLSGTLKIVYAAVTYICAGVCYTGIATPITAILPNLSSDSEERVVLNSYRMVGGNIGTLLTNLVLPLVAILGAGNNRKGFSLTLAVFGIVAILMLVTAFRNLREKNVSELKSIPIKSSLKAVKGNWPWILLVTANLIYWIGSNVRSSAQIYYFEYNLHMKYLVPIVGSLSILTVVGMILIPFMVKISNKRTVMIGALLVAALSNMLLHFSGSNVTLVIIFYVLGSVGSGVACSMPFAMLSDAVDYGQWKTGIRASGFLTSIGSAFCIKAGSGIGGFLPAQIMGAFGYVANKTQTSTSLFGIEFSFVWLPAILFIVACIPMLIYSKYENNENKIKQDLIKRGEMNA